MRTSPLSPARAVARRIAGALPAALLPAALLAAAVALPACVASPVGPGIFYTGVKAPLEATASKDGYSKMGKAKASQVCGIAAWGDASIQTAASSAGIKTIHHVDYEAFSVLGVFSSFEVTVYGD